MGFNYNTMCLLIKYKIVKWYRNRAIIIAAILIIMAIMAIVG